MKCYFKTQWVEEDREACANCKYFYQHYVAVDGGAQCVPCYCGHCVFGKGIGKTTTPNKRCENFQRRTKSEKNNFAY